MAKYYKYFMIFKTDDESVASRFIEDVNLDISFIMRHYPLDDLWVAGPLLITKKEADSDE